MNRLKELVKKFEATEREGNALFNSGLLIGKLGLLVRLNISVISLVYGPPQEAVEVFGYIEGSFLVRRTGDARERHVPNIYRCISV